MRHRARPAALFSLMGMAVRIAERLGIHRDGSLLRLPVLRAEERRRIWWQMQHMEISLAMVLGSLPMTLESDWDCKPPSNLEDKDFQTDMTALPPERRGLTTMSHCLWRYLILDLKRAERRGDGTKAQMNNWHISKDVSRAEKDNTVEMLESVLRERFLQYCEPLEPLHVSIQIGIQAFFVALQRTLRQPALANAKISEMSWKDREDYLSICSRGIEYYMLGATTPSIIHFSWYHENYFQWTGCKSSALLI